MARIALKVDADTWDGTRFGVPALAGAFERAGAQASFLFSLGPDHTGRAALRALRPGFLRKVSRTSVVRHYGLRTLLYGTLLPAPDIGEREAALLRAVDEAGFETGVHGWNHVRWQDGLLHHDADWALREMNLAVERYADIFGRPARLHGAAGWQFNEAAARAEQALGIECASDTRGDVAFVPVDAQGRAVGPPQFPTTLPTLDELIGRDGWDEGNVHLHLLAQTERTQSDHVYTLHAELEGRRLEPVLRKLLLGWRAQGHMLVSLGMLQAATPEAALPRRTIVQATVPGRSGRLAAAGPSSG